MTLSPGKRLKSLWKKNPLLVPGVYDGITALTAKDTGFEALYLSGAALSVAHLGRPDIGLLTLDQVADAARRIVSAVGLPLLVDADTGFGGLPNVKRTVRELERAGAAGIQIEDQVFPKRCGHLSGKQVVDPRDMILKVQAAISARKDKDFVIVARTDARGVTSYRDAYERAQAYKKAGADVIFPEALPSKAEFRSFSMKKELGTLMANMTEFGVSPRLSVSELARLGYRLILFPMTAFRAGAFASAAALKELKKRGHSGSFLKTLQTRKELYRLLQYDAYNRKEKGWLKKAGINLKKA